ncbi:MAG: hypothetical protein DCC71_07335 [Proteobacteria bacterium]|nr:MAG: hypothetical protein DCC71_07335 [Pseudomonadota bacterium]
METTAVRGRGDEMLFRWPLWAEPASLATAASLVRLGWWDGSTAGASMGVIAVCTCVIRRIGQGFGNFGPARINSP